jgi:hypothetical protein
VKKTAVRGIAVINQGIPDSGFMLQGIFKNADLGREVAVGVPSIRRLFGLRQRRWKPSKHAPQ